MRKLFSYLRAYRLQLGVAIIFAIASTVFTVVGPKILGLATTKLFEGVIAQLTGTGTGIDFAYIGNIILLMVGLYLVASVFSYIQGWIMAGVSMNVTYRFRKDISEKINRMPLRYFDGTNHGEVLSRITNDVDTVSQTLNQSLTQIITSVATVIGVLVMMFTISWLMTLVALAIIPLSFGMIALVIGQSQKYFKQQQDYLGHVNGHVEEMYGGHLVMKAFNGEAKSVEQFDEFNDTLYDSAWKSQFLSGLMLPIMNFVGNLGYVAVCILGGYLAINRAITIGDIQAFIQYVRSFTQPITQIANISNVLQQTGCGAERVFEFLAEAEEVPETHPTRSKLPAVEGRVEFDHVHFGYNPDKIIINDFSANIEPGQKIAIVGPTGAGKTTMVKLLMRFYDVNSGAILVDGHDIRDFTRRDLRSMFGMVLQDTWLYNGTIMENIRYGRAQRHRRGSHRRRQGRPRGPLRPHPAGGLQHGAQRRGLQRLAGPDAAADHRPRLPGRPQDADPGRSHQLGGHPHRGADPEGHGYLMKDRTSFHHRPPPVHHPRRRPDPGDERRRHCGAGQTREAAGEERFLRRAVQQPVRNHQGRAWKAA